MSKRTCIICGNRDASAEHIFPAALGGRRTNKGIYCEEHNNGFSGLVASLTEQLKILNALLGVRSDRHKTSKEVTVTKDDGDVLKVNRDGVQRSPASPVKNQKMHLSVTLGGPETLPSIAYIALTFFAHYFPGHVRKNGFDEIKKYIQDPRENDYIWWEASELNTQLPENPFQFGHTIALVTAKKTGKIFAIVSLFQTFIFGVALGAVAVDTDESVVVFIDPQAESPPNDVIEKRCEKVIIELIKPDPIQENLSKMVEDGEDFPAFSEFMKKVEKWRFENEMKANLEVLNQLIGSSDDEKDKVIAKIIEREQARIYRLIEFVIKEYTTKNKAKPELQQIIALLKQYQTDEKGDFSELGELNFRLCMEEFTVDIHRNLDEKKIDMEYLWKLFSTGKGAGMVGEILFQPVTKALLQSQNSS